MIIPIFLGTVIVAWVVLYQKSTLATVKKADIVAGSDEYPNPTPEYIHGDELQHNTSRNFIVNPEYDSVHNYVSQYGIEEALRRDTDGFLMKTAHVPISKF